MGSNLQAGYPAIHTHFVPQVGIGSDGAYLGSSAAFAGYASGTLTIAGTPATGNTVVTTINSHAVTYTLISGDTTTALVATHVAAAINADSTDLLIVLAAAVGSVVTITSLTLGKTGQYSFSTSVTGGGVTSTASDTEFDFANNVYYANTTFQWNFSGQTKTFYKDTPYIIDTTDATAMRALGYVN